MSEPIDLVLSKLPNPKPSGDGKWTCRCPAHEDRRPSLSITVGGDGRVLVKCHAGCDTSAIVMALGLELHDLFPSINGTVIPKQAKPKPNRAKSGANKCSTKATTYKTAAAAVAALERSRGKRSGLWTYHNAQGAPVGLVVRWDRIDGKDILPVSLAADAWRVAGMPEPRPLYQLPELLRREGAVFVTEGEKAADAGRAIGLLTTTSPHGAKAASKADWSALADRDVIFLPDADDAGERYIADVAAILQTLNPPARVKSLRLPDLPLGGDLVDYLAAQHAAGLDAAAVKEKIEELAATTAHENPASPAAVVQIYRPFPVKLIPQPVQGFLRAAATAIGCDAAFVALPTLAALASAVGNSRRIQLKHGWTEPAILWTVIVAESGAKKSPPIDLCLKPLYRRQHEAMKRFTEEMKEYKQALKKHKKELAKWERGKGTGDPPQEPTMPVCERCWCDDTTVEAVLRLLGQQWHGLLMKRDELAAWFGSFDKYSKSGKAGGDVAKWLEMFGARPIINDRVTNNSCAYVPRPALCVCGGIQTGIFKRALVREHHENGLLARLLPAMPPSRARKWTEATVDSALMDTLHDLYSKLFALEPGRDEAGDPVPIDLPLSPEARRSWIAFYNEHAAEQAELTGDLSAAWSKLESYAARLALVIHCVRCAAGDPTADPEAVDAASVASGVALSRWFGQECRRIYAILDESDEEQELRELKELIERKGGRASVRELQQWKHRSYHTADDAETDLQKLVNSGLGKWDNKQQQGSGRPPGSEFVLFGVNGNEMSAKPERNSNSVTVTSDEQRENDDWEEV